MKNKSSSISSGNVPAWMVTFADLMALMMTFFVLLYSFSKVDEEKYKSVVNSMSVGFDGIQWIKNHILNKDSVGPEPGIYILPAIIKQKHETEKKQSLEQPQEAAIKPTSQHSQSEVLFKQINQTFGKEIKSELIHIHKKDNKIVIRFPENVSFPSGSDQLDKEFLPIIHQLGSVLRNAKGKIVIAGHTDDRPIATERFRSNWELSTSRALAVAHHLLKTHKVHPHHIVVVGYSDTQPLVANDSEEQRAKNRRVEISVSNDNTDL